MTGLVLSGSFAALARVLKVLCLALVGYVGVLFVVDLGWGEVLRNLLVPSVPAGRTELALLLAVMGATLPPYVLLWQNVHRLEEMREEDEGGDDTLPLDWRSPAAAVRRRRTSTLDVVAGMAFAVIVMFAVMVSTAATIAVEKPRTIGSAAEAASALEPVAGAETAQDERSIIDSLALLASIFDHREWGRVGEVLVVDATAYGETGVDSIVAGNLRRYLGSCGPSQHLLGNHRIEVDGDRAASVTYARVFHQGKDERAHLWWECMGEYHDGWARTPNGWRMTRRDFTVAIANGDMSVLQPG